MTQEWAPLCMEPPDWAHWQRTATGRVVTGYGRTAVSRPVRPCDDCPMGFAADMRAVGRCNGTPGGVEIEEEPMETPRPLVAITGKEVPVTALLPCDRCAHAPVCRIKPVLEARIETLPVQLPVLDPAIRVALTANVECAQFLRAKGASSQPAGRRGRYQRTPEHSAKIAAANRARAAERRASESAAS